MIDLRHSYDKFLRVTRPYVWDADTLDWVAMEQPVVKTDTLAVNVTGGPFDDPVVAYRISDLDDSSDPQYYGFMDKSGAWMIIKATGGAYRYAKGTSGYSTAWTNRASQSYDYFSTTF